MPRGGERRGERPGRDESLPYGLPVSGSLPGGGGGVKTPPYGANDTWAVMARWRAGHARPLRGGVNRYAREGQGRAAARPLCSGRGVTGNGWRRKARQSPSGLASSASSPLRGTPFARAKPAREASLVKGRCRAQARRRDSRPSAGVTGNPARPVGIPQSPNGDSPL